MSETEIIGKTDFDFFPAEQAKLMHEDDNKVLKSGQPIIGKIERTLLPSGQWNQVITTKVPMFDRKGKIIGTMGFTRDMTKHANFEQERFDMILNALTVLGKALEMRDPYTSMHTRNVSLIAQEIARDMGFSDDEIVQLKLAADLHDLGKISIPLDILIKPGKLSNLEFQMVQNHVENCYELIKDIDFPFPLAEIVYQHHERLDGSGYPRGLRGKQILKEARILAVSDVLEAMTSHRPYRQALGIKMAMDELEKGSSQRYDRRVVKSALKLIDENHGQPFWIPVT
ncbi:MAG: HD domain-containing protein, partial [Candidatus Omnitrophica bacterium]|nr:HD domain-containing protein [Candidatus Omnitrophota bacterium]